MAMIYHKWKLIFVGIPKNASTSLHMMLTNKTDYQGVGHNHRTIFDEYEENDEDLLMHYDSLCIVRNPYDRFFSAFKFQFPYNGPISMDNYKNAFNEFAQSVNKPSFQNNLSNEHYWPQYKFVTMNKRIVVDDILRYESLEDDWKEYQKKWNQRRQLPYKMNLPLLHQNSSDIEIHWSDIYEGESREEVYEYYRHDFEIFGYKK